MPEDIRVPPNVGTEIMGVVTEAAVEAINALAAEVYMESQRQVPRGNDERSLERHGGPLADTGRYPGNDPELAATPASLEATIGYDSEYAHAQHEGFAMMSRAGGEVAWQVSEYTTEGTKSKFLEDPLKDATARLETNIGLAIKARLG